MPDYFNVTTNIGDAEIAYAIATNTKLDITHVAFGDGNGAVPTPTKSRTTLIHEVHRQAVTKYERHATNANWIVIETIIPSNVGGFTIREMGIIANNKLISHGSHAPFEKVEDPSGVSEYRLRFTQNVTDGSVVEITLDESLIYASQAWVEEYFIRKNQIVDNLTTDDATKVASARTVKELEDKKLEATDLKDASTTQKGVVQLNDTLTSTATNQALTAAQGKALQDNKLDKTANAVSATKLQTARTIAGVLFDGTGNIDLPLMGIGQIWQDFSSSRVVGTTYTNSTSKPIFIAIGKSNQTAGMQLNVDGVQVGYANGSNEDSQYKTLYAVIPKGSTYVATGSNFRFWSELR